jgi:translocation and assembly module TamB
MLHRLALLLLILTLATGASAYWLLNTGSGLAFALRLASSLADGRLQVEQADGRLNGPLTIGELRWQDGETRITAADIALTWAPRALFERRLHVKTLSIGSLHVDSPESDEPAGEPADLLLPLALRVEQLRIATVSYGTLEAARELSLGFDSDGHQHRIENLYLLSSDVAVRGQAVVDGTAPFPLQAEAEIQGQLEERPLALALSATGPLAGIVVELTARAGIEGKARLLLTPFAAIPFAEADIRLGNIDPAAWDEGLPDARIDLSLTIKPDAAGISAQFDLVNQRAAPFDKRGLPLDRLSGQATWQDGRLAFPELQARLGGGELSGQGVWQGELDSGALQLALNVRQLDAIRLLSSLRPTRLNGSLTARLGQTQQEIRLDLRDRRFTLRGTARHDTATVSLENIEISSGNARLLADGTLQLGTQTFRADARLQEFDPSRFAELPPARINASLQASGKLQPEPVVDASFTVANSQFRGQPLAGQGKFQLDWPSLSAVDLKLTLAGNRIEAKGGFGRSGQRLELDIDAPHLTALGGEGDLTARLTLSGSLARPLVDGEVRSGTIGLPGVFRAHGVHLTTRLAEAADAPLLFDLALARLESGDGQRLLAPLNIKAEGSRGQHRVDVAGVLGSGERLKMRVDGSEKDGRWQGMLEQFALDASSAARNLRLRSPAPLRASADAWSVGPLQLAGDPLDWLATFRAEADHKALKLDLQASGSRIGRVQATLTAGMNGPWQLAGSSPWQGSAEAAIADLGWLGELLGEGWKTAGQLNARLQLAGSPARPLLAGTLNGQALSLHLPAQGLALNDGELAADIANNLLSIRRLGFNSVRQRAPRALRLALGNDAGRLDGPGRLEISGEMRVGAEQPAGQAALSIRLDRVGIWQRQDQWVSVSGEGQLRWQEAALGINGRLTVDAAYWQLAPAGAPRLSDDVVVHRPGDKPVQALRPSIELDVNTELGRHFLFEGAGLSTRLAGQVRLTASGRDLPRASGTIRTRDGRFEAYGQRLEITRGILTFRGLPDNPALDVRAVRKGLSVEPGVQLSGTAQRPVVRLISDPDLPDSDKLSWLILGHGPENMGAGDASLLLSAAGSLLGNDSGNVVQQLKRSFGIDEFGVRQGNLDDSGSRQPGSRVVAGSIDTASTTGNQILSIGKRLSSSATLSYEQSLGTAESIVKLSIALTREITLIGRAGSDNALDLFYTLTWGLPPTSRRQNSRRQQQADTEPED